MLIPYDYVSFYFLGLNVSKTASTSGGASSASVSNMSKEHAKNLPSFWIPSLTPSNKEAKKEKPVSASLCMQFAPGIRCRKFFVPLLISIP